VESQGDTAPGLTFQRIGAACACGGAVMGLIGHVFHGEAGVSPQGLTSLAEGGQFRIYEVDHLALFLAVVGIVGGMAAVTDVIRGEPQCAWARFGLLAGVLGGAVMLVGIAIDGFTMVRVAKAWAAATLPQEREALFQVAFGVWWTFVHVLGLGILMLFGVTPLLYALSMRGGEVYPKWLPQLAAAGGLVGLGLGFAMTFFTLTYHMYAVVFGITASLESTWLVAACLINLRSLKTVRGEELTA